MITGILIGIVIAGIVAAIVIVVMNRNTASKLEKQEIANQELLKQKVEELSRQLKQNEELLTAQATAERTRIATELDNSNRRIGELSSENETLKSDKQKLQDENKKLNSDLNVANSRCEEQEKQYNLWKTEFEKQKDDSLKLAREQFENVSQNLLKQRQEEFAKANTENMGSIVTPLRNELENMRKILSETKTSSDKNTSSLEGAIKAIVDQTKNIGNKADALADAMRNKGKVQGDWGEQVLETILNQSGLVKDVNYFIQKNYKNDDLANDRTDVVVKFPDDTCIVIDSKVTLTAYVDYIQAQTKEEQEKAQKATYNSLSEHVGEIVKKNYPKTIKNSIRYTLMFVPNEGAYTLALNYKHDLLIEAYKKGVIILNPTNLMLTLTLIEHTWQNSRQEENYTKIIKMATDLYDKFSIFNKSFENIGTNITKTAKVYNEALKQLQNGNGNINKRIESLKRLGAKSTKEINDNINEAISTDDADIIEDDISPEETLTQIPEKTTE